MKNILLFIFVLLRLFTATAHAQELVPVHATTVQPFCLSITWNKTTNLVFPFAIAGVDRGSRDVLAQKAKGVENVLQLKAGRTYFPETNLTVITTDGRLYSCTIAYADSPAKQNFVFATAEPETILFSPDSFNEAIVKQLASAVLTSNKQLHHLHDKHYELSLKLTGIFIEDDKMYFRLVIKNDSYIGYDIEQLRLFVRDQKTVKRTASQELEFKPLYVLNDTSSIAPKSAKELVVVLHKFTIPDKKYLTIQLNEKGGGRHLKLDVKNKAIVKACPIE